MSNYSELCTPSGELLGTGRGTCAKSLGADIKFILTESSVKGTSSEVNSRAFWDAAIKAGTAYPFPEVIEIEPQNVEAAYYEAPSGATFKTKNETRKTMYKFAENIVTHSAMKSYSDRSWKVWFYTKNGFLRGHTISEDLYEGLDISSFYVNAIETANFDAIEQTPVIMEHNEVDDWDKEFFVGQPEFRMTDLEGVFEVSAIVDSSTQLTGTLTVNTAIKVLGSNSALSGLAPTDFELKDASGTIINIDSAVETGTTGVYVIIATSSETTGTVSLKNIVTIGSDNYKSNVATFITE